VELIEGFHHLKDLQPRVDIGAKNGREMIDLLKDINVTLNAILLRQMQDYREEDDIKFMKQIYKMKLGFREICA
jgi:hypothetical protein